MVEGDSGVPGTKKLEPAPALSPPASSAHHLGGKKAGGGEQERETVEEAGNFGPNEAVRRWCMGERERELAPIVTRPLS
jgi:hypothetical protein